MSDQIKIHLVSPDARVARTGNRCTALQWASLLGEIGCDVDICGPDDRIDSEMLVALHGERSHDAIARFRKDSPDGKIVVAMTGTDIYPKPSERVLNSMQMADRIVVLQSKAMEKIPAEFHDKCQVIVQSAEVSAERSQSDSGFFEVCVVGHFREVKDPLRAAFAARQLSESSRIRIRHAGGVLDEKYRQLIENEMAENPRYEWLGEVDEQAVAELLSSSQVMVLSSYAEGGGRVIGEAIVHGTPVLSSKIDAAIGLLGAGYPGFFEAGETNELTALMTRAEEDFEFYETLKSAAESLREHFHPDRERELWKRLIAEI